MPKFKLREVDYGKSEEGSEGGQEDAREGKRQVERKMLRFVGRPNELERRTLEAMRQIHEKLQNEEKSSWTR